MTEPGNFLRALAVRLVFSLNGQRALIKGTWWGRFVRNLCDRHFDKRPTALLRACAEAFVDFWREQAGFLLGHLGSINGQV